jgi:hypothetical protein
MTVAWPSSVPQIQLLPIAFSMVDQRSIFKTDAGEPRTASLSTDQVYIVQCALQLTGAQYKAFLSWWETTAARGSEDFTGFEDVLGDTTSIRHKFTDQSMPTGQIWFSGVNSDTRLWRVDITLWRLPG